ncbi:hypothetical protein GCM10011519_11120 [Marmoricola endophyticus]|uniref:HU family DNA-binding protein n=1 Tax=Marmoricola endophyticus TaxID=2040280 RepID=A0A917BF78_9ACTN|nr:HU family DNA-binding protein [Marmoricola endophyticus]GGF39252.1 hypothetical protein GCM10011519_11120 [Marmoricola endophyticus]
MNKSELIDTLAARFEGNRKAAAHALESVLDTITREVARGEKVAITGFGSFEKRVRDARWVRNPATGERIKAQATAIAKFKPGAELMGVVSGARKLPENAIAAASDLLPGAISDRLPAKKSTAKKTTSSATASSPAKKSSAAKKSSPAAKKSSAAKKSPAAKKSSPAKKSTTAKKSSPAKKSTTAKKSTAAKKTSPAKKTTSATTSTPATKSS